MNAYLAKHVNGKYLQRECPRDSLQSEDEFIGYTLERAFLKEKHEQKKPSCLSAVILYQCMIRCRRMFMEALFIK